MVVKRLYFFLHIPLSGTILVFWSFSWNLFPFQQDVQIQYGGGNSQTTKSVGRGGPCLSLCENVRL